jgi:hypothetical protein
MIVTGSSTVVLRAATRAFEMGMNISVGRVPCNVTAVSDDGLWALVVLPKSSVICNIAGGSDCGYRSLTLSTAHHVSHLSATQRRLSRARHRGVALTCPPFCPGLWGASIPAVFSSDGAVTFAHQSPIGAPVPVPTDGETETSTGLYYAEACSQTGVYGGVF